MIMIGHLHFTAIYEEEKCSNLWLYPLSSSFDAAASFVTMNRAQDEATPHRDEPKMSALAVGAPFLYWNWFSTTSDQAVKENLNFKFVDFGGRKVVDLVVKPRYDSIKDEALESGYLSAEQFQRLIVEKANRFFENNTCRKLKANQWNDYHFGISRYSPVEPRHLHSLFLYTDWSEKCGRSPYGTAGVQYQRLRCIDAL